jgi:hypothetical protein
MAERVILDIDGRPSSSFSCSCADRAGWFVERVTLSPAVGRSWRQSVRTMSARVCASPLSLLAPEVPAAPGNGPPAAG